MGEVVEGFLAFRRPFLAEAVVVARRRGFDMGEVTGLYEDAELALDHLLVATMSGHGLGAEPAPSRPDPCLRVTVESDCDDVSRIRAIALTAPECPQRVTRGDSNRP